MRAAELNMVAEYIMLLTLRAGSQTYGAPTARETELYREITEEQPSSPEAGDTPPPSLAPGTTQAERIANTELEPLLYFALHGNRHAAAEIVKRLSSTFNLADYPSAPASWVVVDNANRLAAGPDGQPIAASVAEPAARSIAHYLNAQAGKEDCLCFTGYECAAVFHPRPEE